MASISLLTFSNRFSCSIIVLSLFAILSNLLSSKLTISQHAINGSVPKRGETIILSKIALFTYAYMSQWPKWAILINKTIWCITNEKLCCHNVLIDTNVAMIINLLPKYNILIGIAIVELLNPPCTFFSFYPIKGQLYWMCFWCNVTQRPSYPNYTHQQAYSLSLQKNPNWLSRLSVIQYRNGGYYFRDQHGHDTTMSFSGSYGDNTVLRIADTPS